MENELLRKRFFEITAEKTSLYTYQSLPNMTFHDLSEFPKTYVKQLLSKSCQNNLVFNVFFQIMTHASVHI